MYQEQLGNRLENPDSIESKVLQLYEETAQTIDQIAANVHLEETRTSFRKEIRSHLEGHPEDTDFMPKIGHAHAAHRQWVIAERQQLVASEKIELMGEQANTQLAELILGKTVRVHARAPESNGGDPEVIEGSVECVSALIGSFTLRHSATSEHSEVYVFHENDQGVRMRGIDLEIVDAGSTADS